MVKIVQKDDPVLREKAKTVPLSDIGTPKLNKIIEDMKIAVDSCYDGVAIAAPQIGVPLRIFVVSPKALIPPEKEVSDEELKKMKHQVFINPAIKKLSSKRKVLDEGCLSVRGIFGKVKRAERATVEAYDESGKKIMRGASGLLAEIFQHETEHLDGILFIDHADEIYKVTDDENAGNKNK